jgi:hypothetical protein
LRELFISKTGRKEDEYRCDCEADGVACVLRSGGDSVRDAHETAAFTGATAGKRSDGR